MPQKGAGAGAGVLHHISRIAVAEGGGASTASVVENVDEQSGIGRSHQPAAIAEEPVLFS